MITKFNFHHAKLLEPYFLLDTKIKQPDYTYPSIELFNESLESHKKKWSSIENSFFKSLVDTFGFKFKKKEYDVYIVRGARRSMSKPFIVKFSFDYEKFENQLMHEFIHIYLVENSFKHNFNKENRTTRNHIHLFAFMKKFYNEILGDKNKWLQLILNTKDLNYKRALEIVEDKGYSNLLKKG